MDHKKALRARNSRRRRRDRSDADYNAFGYDPIGLVAYLAAYFYGPKWRPAPSDNILHLEGKPQAPRYGPPAPYQIPHLPTDFKVRPPPNYYGHPYPPYLPAPTNFHPDNFAALRLARVRIVSCEVEMSIDGIFSMLIKRIAKSVQEGMSQWQIIMVMP